MQVTNKQKDTQFLHNPGDCVKQSLSAVEVARTPISAATMQTTDTMQIHIGKLISDEIIRQGHTNEWFMDRIGVSERALQRLFSKPSIDSQQLLLISSVLKTNFFRYYSDALQSPSNTIKQQSK